MVQHKQIAIQNQETVQEVMGKLVHQHKHSNLVQAKQIQHAMDMFQVVEFVSLIPIVHV